MELRDDHRGIPETNYYNSSANEYFVDGIGWLDDPSYDRALKMSGLSAKDFYAKVTEINITYVDTKGRTGQMDVSKQDYDLLTEKTYSAEHKDEYEAAKLKLENIKREAGITEKPVEYYAVRQMNDRKFCVCSISADGLVTTVKPNILTIAEAKKAMLEIFDRKKDSVKCEFVHPQTLDEKSADIFKGQSKELPDVTYRINLNTDSKSSDTHILQEYIKNADDTYAVGKIAAKGDYDVCNAKLADILSGKDVLHEFDIYQIKGGDDTRDIRFEPYERLKEAGKRPEFHNYEKVFSGSSEMLNAGSGNVGDQLEAIYKKFNNDRPDDFKGHSLSVSDVVVLDKKAYYVDSIGFQPLRDFMPLERRRGKSSDKSDSPEQEKPKPQRKPKI